MRYPVYPAYKDSGVEWLGEVPEHWEVKRGRFVMQVNPSSPKLRKLNPEAEVSFVPMDAVGEYGGLRLDQTKQIDEVGTGYTEFQNGDVVVAKITPCFENGKGALAHGLMNEAAFGTTELHVLRPLQMFDRAFLFYLSISSLYREAGESEMYGAGGQKRVPPEFNKNFRTPLPPVNEQHAIADFLDTQTAKIDALLAKKRELIERLKEKRTALISRTVTRGLPPEAARAAGLDPHPPLKDSGVEWLGEVPEHWVQQKVKLCYSIQLGKMLQPEPSNVKDMETPYFKAQHVQWYDVRVDDLPTMWASKSDRIKYAIVDGDLLVCEGGDVGRAGIVRNPPEGAIIQNALHRVRPLSSNDSRYLLYVLAHAAAQGWFDILCNKSTIAHFTGEKFGALGIALPLESEQQAIANFLDRETAKIDQLVAKTEEIIERLHEYRTTLITAAVTGKIDARGGVV